MAGGDLDIAQASAGAEHGRDECMPEHVRMRPGDLHASAAGEPPQPPGQVDLAARAGMTQPALPRLEAGGVIPTIPLPDRISPALDADLIVQLAPHAA